MQVCCYTSLLPRSSATPLPASPRDATSPGSSATASRPHMPSAARRPGLDDAQHAATTLLCPSHSAPATIPPQCTRTHTSCATRATHEHAMRPAPSRSARGVRDNTRVHATKSRHRGGRDRASRSHGHKSLCHVVSRAVLAPPRDPTLPAPANDAAGTRAGGIPRQRERRAAAHGIPRRGAPPATGAAARAACVAADTRGRRQGGGPPQARLCAHPPPLWATAWRGRRRAYSGPTTSMTTRPSGHRDPRLPPAALGYGLAGAAQARAETPACLPTPPPHPFRACRVRRGGGVGSVGMTNDRERALKNLGCGRRAGGEAPRSVVAATR